MLDKKQHLYIENFHISSAILNCQYQKGLVQNFSIFKFVESRQGLNLNDRLRLHSFTITVETASGKPRLKLIYSEEFTVNIKGLHCLEITPLAN